MVGLPPPLRALLFPLVLLTLMTFVVMPLGRVSRIASGPVGSGPQPDEDVGDGDGGLVAVGELVKAGRDRAELCAAVHQPLDLIAVAVTDPVKGRRPATTGATTGAVGLLIIPLRDRVPDVAGPQRRPVGPAAIGLIPGQVIGTYPRPAAPTRPGHPHGIDQPHQLAGVGVLARSQPGGQVPTPAIADGVQLGGQPTPRPAQRLLAACLDRRDPPLRAPAACW